MNQKREKKKKKDRSILEKEINSFMTACMRACLNQALDDIFKSWNTSANATIQIPYKI
jgi:hypothetical protein